MTQQLAQGLASFGRGPDTELVHMAPSEVKSLQQLAEAHGGSLTTNPHTGLQEAGFLSSLLPMMIGAGLSVASGGALTPMMAAMMTAGGYGVATGSLKKGLMAGLGAYGGAGLGAGLAEAGVQAAAAPEIAASQAGVSNLASNAAGTTLRDAAGNLTQAGSDYAANVAAQTAPAQTAIANAGLDKGIMGNLSQAGQGLSSLTSQTGRNAFMAGAGGSSGLMQAGLTAAGPLFGQTPATPPAAPGDASMGQRYSYSPGVPKPQPAPDVPAYGDQGQNFGKEQRYYNPAYTPISPDAAKTMYGYAGGGPVEAMSNANAIGANTGYPMADIHTGAYATPYQQPMSQNVVQGAQDSAVDPYTGQATFAAGGGISTLGGYSDGGRLLKGPGDGVSDSIPAVIGKKQPARLADGEFVIPARIVSELGNGSTEAGARQLYSMMERIQSGRQRSIGKNKVATNTRAAKHLPA